jgi:formate dehydrogenase maturation protein FdhE
VGAASSLGLAPSFVSWDERIARARLLAPQEPQASEILTFYAALAEYQQALAGVGRPDVPDPADPPGPAPSPFAATLDFDAAARAVPGFLRWLSRNAPERLAEAVEQRGRIANERWSGLLRQSGEGQPADLVLKDPVMGFVVEAILQPFAERAAVLRRAGANGSPAADRSSHCPVCGNRPVVAALREEGQGARRTFVCPLCFTEWDYLRVLCPACKENRFDALPVYTADTRVQVRVDACDSCRTYIKTIDLTKDGLAVPIVDDLASVPLDLWARVRGYQRLYPNLLRL